MLAAVHAVTTTTLAAIGWEPEIRGALTVILAVGILCGSIYLILATNTGSRLGFLLAFTGLMGWMLLMGIIWTIYGIGLVGDAPTWEVTEVVVGDIGQAETEEARSLEDWTELPPGHGDRGDAQAAADDFLANNGQEVFGDEVPPLVTVAAFDKGGKDDLDGDPACSPHTRHLRRLLGPHRPQARDHLRPAPPPHALRRHPGAAGSHRRRRALGHRGRFGSPYGVDRDGA